MTPTAERQAQQATRHLLETWGEPAALAFVQRLDAALRFVMASPEAGTPRPAWADAGIPLRTTTAGRYLVVYASEHEPPTVVAIFHERMDVATRIGDQRVVAELDETPRDP